VTYRSVLGNREFAGLLAAQVLSTTGDQLARIAIALLVYSRTGSAFAASATYAVSYLTYLLGGPVLSAVSDRNPRLTVMVVCDLLRAPLVLLLCVDQVPLWAVFVLLGGIGVLAPPFDSARSAVQPDILVGDSYVVGSAIMNVGIQAAQVLGFMAGGAIVAATSVRGALGLDAASFLVSAGLVLAALKHRAAAQASRASLLSDAADGFRLVGRTPELRRLLAFAILSSAAIIAPEGLAVPIASELGKGALAAGILTGSIPAGFLLGSVLVLRLPMARRLELLPRLAVLGALPLLLSPLVDDVRLLAALWFVAGIGGTVNLVAAAAYVQACPRDFRSRAYGVAITSLNAVQGVVLLAAGALADPFAPRTALALVAALTLLVILAFVSGRPEASQENRDLVRSSAG
jgi:hypothetical protein